MSETKPKQVLLAITGLSPQVVTETLYAIAKQGLEWPDQIQIITTQKGKQQAELGLLTCHGGDTYHRLHQLCKDYDKAVPKCSVDDIYVVPDANGDAVDDARTELDQEALADYIVSHVARLCADTNVRLHASLAGGRKTMTFYLGYAMTLFARPGDRLSHVLVDQAYEGLPDFYYPTPKVHAIKGRNDNEMLDASKAKVVLSEIPFIRQRGQLKQLALQGFSDASSIDLSPSYRDLVRYQNMALERENLRLTFDLPGRQIFVFQAEEKLTTIDFSGAPLELAFYAMVARHNRVIEPFKILRPVEGEFNQELAYKFICELLSICELAIPNAPLSTEFTEWVVETAEQGGDMEQFHKSLKALEAGMPRSVFDQRKNALKNHLLKQFPQSFVDCILPAGVFRKNPVSKQYERCAFEGKTQANSAVGLWLKEEQVSMENVE